MSVPYHRLFRVHSRWRWWRPLVALAVFLGFYLVSQVLIAIGFFVPILARSGVAGLQRFAHEIQHDALSSTDPLVLGLTLASLVLLLPAIMAAVRIAGLGPWGQLSSVRFRVRWGWMARCLLPLLVLAVLTVGIQGWSMFHTPGAGFLTFGTRQLGHQTVSSTTLIVTVVMVVVLVPFQAAAEEYIFRGFLMQTIGSWVRNPIPAVLVSTICFALLHLPNGYDVWGIVDVGSFGAIAAILAWRTGGLESGILAHALNNVVIFLLQAPGWSRLDITSSDGSAGGAIVTIVTMGIYALLVDLLARRSRLDRRRPGAEGPRFRGRTPIWSSTVEPGWEAVPTTVDVLPTSDASVIAHTGTDREDRVGGRP
ncbi:CPBP family intramembrane glutamic endopeptidase [Curtobacterium sp. MCBD17_019]|uniref:CPBP family intramembrane glutamic endopeptidase n=1 Tax=Curtobacterium sp. MCBD17_019 TaxID=2175669 RepID=UPI000DA7F8DF|nr:CPBP family intramembrane glutamic endopeptidase [Curtobacterium sp. MCBD17_019]PZE78394.1 hypothetical protein DEI82_01065 [Curtobacterium sp. MCBD17_019]